LLFGGDFTERVTLSHLLSNQKSPKASALQGISAYRNPLPFGFSERLEISG
jgi:hypothetical protein